MLDWNGNGTIDPVDIGVSIAVDSAARAEEEPVQAPARPKKKKRPSLWQRLRKKGAEAEDDGDPPPPAGGRTIALISCVKQKRAFPYPARDLYAPSPLFFWSYQYARQWADEIFILSAKYGLLAETETAAPYDVTLKTMSRAERLRWADRVLDQLRTVCDPERDRFVILAGRDYYENLLPHLPRASLPLGRLSYGERVAYLKDLVRNGPQTAPTEEPSAPRQARSAQAEAVGARLHRFLSALPRYGWQDIQDLSCTNGIYVFFEAGETWRGLPRVVRVGTHTAPDRLPGRLADHYIREDRNGSIFRKNIGKALLNRAGDPYLSIWSLDTGRPDNASRADPVKEARIEAQVTAYLRDHCTFAVLPAAQREDRLRLEEGIIAALHALPDFGPGPDWLGRHSPEAAIRQSGLWLKQGLDGVPLTARELDRLIRAVKSPGGGPQPRPAAPCSVPPAAPALTLAPGDRIRHNVFGPGVVTGTRPIGQDVLVEADFDRHGPKRLMLRAAGPHIKKLD